MKINLLFLLISFVSFFCFSSMAPVVLAQEEEQTDLQGVSQTLGEVNSQLESVQEKGIIQTILDNTLGQFVPLLEQIKEIFANIGSILSSLGG